MTTHVALAAARSTPRELHRVRSDASLARQPASSFASLRSSNRNLMRGESMTGAEHRPVTHSIDETRAMAGPDSVRKRHSPKVLARKPSVHPVMMKRFPALRSAGARAMEPPPSGTWDGLDGADADLGGGSGGGYGGASSPQSRQSRGSRGSRGSRRSRRSSTGMRKSASAASTRSSRRVRSTTRLYDRALTASSMDSINWLPRFRKAIAISHAKNPLPGAAAALAMTGTLRTIKRTRTKEQRAESAAALANRGPFRPSGQSAKYAIASDNHGFTSVGTPYNAVHRMKVEAHEDSKSRYLAGEFQHPNRTQAQRDVRTKVYLNSPDEWAQQLERQHIKQRALLATADYEARGIGRARSKGSVTGQTAAAAAAAATAMSSSSRPATDSNVLLPPPSPLH